MLEKLKKKIQERIEKNAIKLNDVEYTDSKGKKYKEDIIIKRSNMPLVGDWARIYPPIDEYGNINWINFIFGGKKNLIRLLIILGFLTLIFLGFVEVFSNYESLKEACKPFINVSR